MSQNEPTTPSATPEEIKELIKEAAKNVPPEPTPQEKKDDELAGDYAEMDDPVDESSAESFPASDPPAH